MSILLTFLLAHMPALEAQNFKHGGVTFESTEREVTALYPRAERTVTGERTKYTCYSNQGVFTVDFVGGQVKGFVLIDLRPGVDVPARRQQLREQFGPSLCKDEAKSYELWLFPEVHRGVYHKVTSDAVYLVVDKR